MRRHRFSAIAATLVGLSFGCLVAVAAEAPEAADPALNGPPDATEVRVERVKPKRAKHVTLKFLKENRDFIRARFDLLRQLPEERRARAEEIDPRYLRYQELLAAVHAGADSASAAETERQRRELMASVTMLGDLEAQLDQMERLLAAQRLRLGILQDDFTGDQRTALVIVIGGRPAAVVPTEISVVLEDGTVAAVPLTPEHQEALRGGGVVQIFHDFVEPREQVVEIAVAGQGSQEANRGYITLEPARNRITFLRLDLSDVHGTSGMSASTWLHDTRVPAGDG